MASSLEAGLWLGVGGVGAEATAKATRRRPVGRPGTPTAEVMIERRFGSEVRRNRVFETSSRFSVAGDCRCSLKMLCSLRSKR